MESIIEQQRRFHEERERLEEATVREMIGKKNSVSYWICFRVLSG
jgi:hypothetical protein